MNPFKMFIRWLDSQTPTNKDDSHRDPPNWKGFFREVFKLRTWIDIVGIKEVFRHAFNQDIDHDPLRDGNEENYTIGRQS